MSLLGIDTTGQAELVENSYESMRSYIGGYLESISSPGPFDMYGNDEAMLIGLPLNVVASMLVQVPIYGPIIVCSHDDEGNTQPPPSVELVSIKAMARVWEGVYRYGVGVLGQNMDLLAGEPPPPRFTSIPGGDFIKGMEAAQEQIIAEDQQKMKEAIPEKGRASHD